MTPKQIKLSDKEVDALMEQWDDSHHSANIETEHSEKFARVFDKYMVHYGTLNNYVFLDKHERNLLKKLARELESWRTKKYKINKGTLLKKLK